jgi:hypothetical protein
MASIWLGRRLGGWEVRKQRDGPDDIHTAMKIGKHGSQPTQQKREVSVI